LRATTKKEKGRQLVREKSAPQRKSNVELGMTIAKVKWAVFLTHSAYMHLFAWTQQQLKTNTVITNSNTIRYELILWYKKAQNYMKNV